VNDFRVAWRIARRELNLQFRGLRLLLACLFLGVGALAAIGSLTQAIDDELSARGSTILGGDVEFAASQRAALADERAAMGQLGRVSQTVRMQAMAARRGTSVPIELKGVDSAYPLYGALAFAPRTGRATLPADGVWISSALAERMGIGKGAALNLGRAGFVVTGVLTEEPDRLGEGFTLGPVAIVSLDGIARTGLVQPGSLYESKYRVRLPDGDAPQAAIDRIKTRFPNAGWETKTRDRAAPGAARFVERMGQFLLLVGLAALVIAGIGVGNGVSS
jgi:putative ABC transport system permease protein